MMMIRSPLLCPQNEDLVRGFSSIMNIDSTGFPLGSYFITSVLSVGWDVLPV